MSQSASPELSKAAACDLPPTTLASAKLDLGDVFLVADLALRGDDWGTRACRAANQAYEVAHFSCNDLCYLTLSPCPGIPPHPTCHPAPARPYIYNRLARRARARVCARGGGRNSRAIPRPSATATQTLALRGARAAALMQASCRCSLLWSHDGTHPGCVTLGQAPMLSMVGFLNVQLAADALGSPLVHSHLFVCRAPRPVCQCNCR